MHVVHHSPGLMDNPRCRAAQEAHREAAMREREAGKLHDMHQRKKESLTPLEAELDNLRRYLLCPHPDPKDALLGSIHLMTIASGSVASCSWCMAYMARALHLFDCVHERTWCFHCDCSHFNGLGCCREREHAHANHQSLLGDHNDRHKKHQARSASPVHTAAKGNMCRSTLLLQQMQI